MSRPSHLSLFSRLSLLVISLMSSSVISLSSCRRPPPDLSSPEVLLGHTDRHLTEASPRLLPEVSDALQRMAQDAKRSGFKLKVVSGYRSYSSQRSIWNRKYQRYTDEGLSPSEVIARITMYSTIPGTSRHHWGTEIDLIDETPHVEGDVLLAEHFHDGGPYEALRVWLEQNAARYGFHRAYTAHPERGGFSYEPWHYSYAPRAREMYQAYLQLDLTALLTGDGSLLGSAHLNREALDIYREVHIKGINPTLGSRPEDVE